MLCRIHSFVLCAIRKPKKMKEYIPIYIILTIIAILVYLLLRLIIVNFYKFKSKKYSSKRYPIILGLSLLVIPVFFYGSSSLIINFLIDFLENNHGYKFKNSSEQSYSFLIWYLILATSVSYILSLYISYIKKRKYPKHNFQENRIQTKNIYEAGITKYTFKKLSKEQLEEEYLKTTYGSIKIHRLNETCKYSVVKEGLSKSLLIIMNNQPDNAKEIINNFKNHSNEIRKILEPIKKKRIRYNIKFILFGTYLSDLSKEIINILHDDIIFNYDNFQGYLIDLKEDFTENKVQYSYDNELSLKDIFVKPIVELNRETNISAIEYIDAWIHDDSTKDQLIISGEYGLGKTTLLKYISYTLSKKIIDGETGVRIPIYIELTNEFPYRKGIDSVLFKFFKEHNISFTQELLGHLIYSGAFIFLLDGFDEIGYIGSNDERYNNLLSIWDLAQGNNKIIVSGRLSYFQSIDKENSILKNLTLQSVPNQFINNDLLNIQFFSTKEIKEFIRHKFKTKSLTTEAFNFIHKNRALHDMCSRPYLLHLTTEMMKELKSKDDVDELNAFQLIELYVNKWITRQREKRIQSNFIDSNEKVQFIQTLFIRIAKHLYENGLSHKEIDMEISKSQLSILLEECDHTFIEGVTIQGIESEIFSSYFIERRDNNFSFVHKSIYEYFVAKAILLLIENNEKDQPLFNNNWTNEILNLVYEGFDHKFGFRENKNEAPLLLQQITEKSSIIHKIVDFSAKLHLKFRDIIFYTILRNIVLFYTIYVCAFTQSKPGIILGTFVFTIISTIVRDPVENILNIQSLNRNRNKTIIAISAIYSTWYYSQFFNGGFLANFALNFMAFISTFTLMFFILTNVFSFLNKNLLKSHKVKSILKSYYSQLVKEELSTDYFTRMLAFLNFVDSRPLVLENKLIEAEHCKLPFKNLHFKNCSFRINRLYNFNCYFDIVKIAGASFREIHFNQCKLHKLDLSKVTKVGMYRKYEQMTKKSGVMLEKFSLTNMKPEDIDEYSIRTFKKYLKANNLDISAAKVDEWMISKFE